MTTTRNPFAVHAAPANAITIDPRTGAPAEAPPPEPIREELERYAQEWARTHPDASEDDYKRAVRARRAELTQQLLDTDPAVQALRRRGEERDRAAAAEAQRVAREDETRVQAAAAEELERERVLLRARFLANGGTAAEFDQQWPAMRLRSIEQRAMAEAQQAAQDTQERVRRVFGG